MLEYFALFMLIFVVITLFYGIIVIHDIPYEIAHKRNHPHQDAIHAAGWISIIFLHVLWPFLWIWSMMYRPERGWGFGTTDKEKEEAAVMNGRVDQLLKRVADLEAERQQRPPKGPRAVPAPAALTIDPPATPSVTGPLEPTPPFPASKRRSG